MVGPILKLGRVEVKKGKVRETRLKDDYEKRGFQVLNAKNYNTGVDILVINPKDGRIMIAVESTNYSDTSYIGPERAKRYANSLGQFPYADKILVISYDKNVGEKAKKILVKANVRIITVGHQE